MSDNPHEVQLVLAEFDRSQLPESQRDVQGDDFRRAVQDHLSAQFIDEGGAAEVVVTKDRIIIRWSASSEAKSITERGINWLKEGDSEKGIATLRLALLRNPTDSDALFNLGMALSDQGVLEESVNFLKQSVAMHPSHAHGWVALGVAQARMGDDASAIESLKKAVIIDPKDGYSHKNLGALLSRMGNANEALKHLQTATQMLPTDPDAWFNLAGTLAEAGVLDGADEAYKKVIHLAPNGQLAHRSEAARNRIVESTFRERGVDLRPDAFSYCFSALQRFDGMPKAEIQRITFEIAMLGTRGLRVNDPAEQYTLNAIPGKFSGLHLLCIEYVGFKLIDPSVDLGFDLSAEYAAACLIRGKM
ncbi:MAG: tetratricopeptide repeat protein [Proteobacteria bacterium]|nr:tetratricopeptide repeat protein [Pseudomonadota bacterium]